jgi:hypothetical protein
MANRNAALHNYLLCVRAVYCDLDDLKELRDHDHDLDWTSGMILAESAVGPVAISIHCLLTIYRCVPKLTLSWFLFEWFRTLSS